MKEKRIFRPNVWLIPGLLAVALLVALHFGRVLLQTEAKGAEEEYRTYQYHIALISYESDTSFWHQVYDSAVQTGKENDAYVEEIGQELTRTLSMEEAMEVAIYQGVDGILLRPGDEQVTQPLIDKAIQAGIPVITMQKDVPTSLRQGFVGINEYFMGQEYGKRITKIATEDTQRVMVLFPGDGFNSNSRTWFRMGITDALAGKGIQLDFRIIWEDNGINNAEDILQEMLQEDSAPHVIVCLDEVLTQSAYQMVRRLSAPQVQIIGSYANQEILEGIRLGYIDSTITIDPAVMGQKSMEAMMTYLTHHMVSYYTEVDTQLIDAQSELTMEDELP